MRVESSGRARARGCTRSQRQSCSAHRGRFFERLPAAAAAGKRELRGQNAQRTQVRLKRATHTSAAGRGQRRDWQSRRGHAKVAHPGLRAARSARPLRSRLVAGAWGAAAPQPRMGRRSARSRGRLCRREERWHKVRIHLRSRRAHRCTVAGRGRAPRRCRRVRHCVLAFGSRGLDAC